MDDQKLMKKRLKVLMNRPENQVCADCPERSPRWASLIVVPPGAPPGSTNLGAFMCLECSGSHRRLGVHIAFVRSINLDSWKEKEVVAMENGGNFRVNAIFEAHLPNPNIKPHNHADGPTRERFIRDKYERRKYYDPNGFTSTPATPTAVPRKTNSPVPTHENDRMAPRRTESVGPPSDAARLRLEERRQRIKHSNSTLDKPSNGVGLFPATGNKEKAKKSVAKAPNSAPAPSIDLLDFGVDTGGASQPDNQTDLFNTNNFSSGFGSSAPEPVSQGSDVQNQASQPKAGGIDMFEFLTKDTSQSQPQTSQTMQPNSPYGGDILSLYNNNGNAQRSSFGNGMVNDPAMNGSMPSLVSYNSNAGNGLADSFTNLAVSGSNPNSMGVMQQRNQMMYPQQPNMNNGMPMNNPMMNNPMMNNTMMMQNSNGMNNPMMNNTMMMQNSNGMMMQGGANPMYAQSGANPMYAQGGANPMYAQGGTNPMYAQGGANPMYAQGGLGNNMMQGNVNRVNNGSSPMNQQNSFQMPGYGAGQTNYSNPTGVGNQMGRGNINKQPVVEKDDPFAQFGMNVFRS